MAQSDPIASEAPPACNVAPFTDAQRERWRELGARWRSRVEEIGELPDGYALRIPVDTELIVSVAEWMSLDRLCCPFFTSTLELERDGGPAWLKLTGTARAKEFLRQAISETN